MIGDEDGPVDGWHGKLDADVGAKFSSLAEARSAWRTIYSKF